MYIVYILIYIFPFQAEDAPLLRCCIKFACRRHGQALSLTLPLPASLPLSRPRIKLKSSDDNRKFLACLMLATISPFLHLPQVFQQSHQVGRKRRTAGRQSALLVAKCMANGLPALGVKFICKLCV